MRKPNFFIIGAPKCGTTSLASWLAGHDNIYMSPQKEPHHFNIDHNHLVYKELADYESLFYGVNGQHHAVGEASVWYLHSKKAVEGIESYSPESKYIVCLRNPVDMAYSLHEQQVFNGNEDVLDFSKAWTLSPFRLSGKKVGSWCREPVHLAYSEVCLLGDQLRRLYDQVPRERVITVLMDDMKGDPEREYRRALRFLGVRDDVSVEFSVKNTAKERRSVLLQRGIRILGSLKGKLGIRKSLGVLAIINSKNTRYRQREPLSPEMRVKLEEHFHNDIMLLGELLDRDLSGWLRETGR